MYPFVIPGILLCMSLCNMYMPVPHNIILKIKNKSLILQQSTVLWEEKGIKYYNKKI